jgi:hypothetical protein
MQPDRRVNLLSVENRMNTTKTFIKNHDGNPLKDSVALLWGNNAAWLCIECRELLGNRTGDTEYQVACQCGAKYEIERTQNKSGNLNLGAAIGIRQIR